MTPEEVGRAFASMPTDGQARFWNGVAAETRSWPNNAGYAYGEMQWCWLRDEMLKPENAEGMAALQSISAWALFHAWELR